MKDIFKINLVQLQSVYGETGIVCEPPIEMHIDDPNISCDDFVNRKYSHYIPYVQMEFNVNIPNLIGNRANIDNPEWQPKEEFIDLSGEFFVYDMSICEICKRNLIKAYKRVNNYD